VAYAFVLARNDKTSVRENFFDSGDNPHRHLWVVNWMKGSHPKKAWSQNTAAPIRIGRDIQNVWNNLYIKTVTSQRLRQKWRRSHKGMGPT
jgi:hypothetical protein